jgi:hypothetical protein
MYAESGGPCGETPPALASSIQDMLLFSRRYSVADGTSIIEVFPGVADMAPPLGPGNVTFYQLRALGAWLVSAKWILGKGTQFVTIQSTATSDRTCRIRVNRLGDGTSTTIRIQPQSTPYTIRNDGDIDVTITSGGSVTFYTINSPPPFDITPDPGTSAEFNSWGVH